MKRTVTLWAAGLVGLLSSWTWGQDESSLSPLEQQLKKATQRAVSETCQLRYKLKAGQQLAYRVEHLAEVNTTIQKSRQSSKSRSISTKVWHIQKVDADGTVHFTYAIRDVDMWSQINDQQPVRYQSRKDKDPPLEYQPVASTVGKPLAVVSMDATGKVLDRKDQIQQINLGVGGLVVPLPKEPVRAGATWSMPSTVRVRLKDGRPKVIKTRQLYELKSVEAGVATITIKTQVLTPVRDARVRSQLLQRLAQGEIKFDVDAGYVLSKQMDWNEKVVGFDGPDSNMEYVAQFMEKLDPEAIETAKKE